MIMIIGEMYCAQLLPLKVRSVYIPTIPYTNYTMKLDRIAISISGDYIKKNTHAASTTCTVHN